MCFTGTLGGVPETNTLVQADASLGLYVMSDWSIVALQLICGPQNLKCSDMAQNLAHVLKIYRIIVLRCPRSLFYSNIHRNVLPWLSEFFL